MSVNASRFAIILFALNALLFADIQLVAAQNGCSACDRRIACDGCTACDGNDACDGYDACDSSCDCGCDKPLLYGALRLGAAFNRLESGGFNTAGGFPNTGSDDDDSFDIGGAIGLAVPIDAGTMRLECEAMSRDMFDSVTNSFAPPTPTFFYRVHYSDRWSVMGNAWFDGQLTDRLDIYVGGGVGTGGGRITLADNIVQGQKSFHQLAWQTGCGLKWQYSDCVDIDLGYRYVDYGDATVALRSIIGNAPAGNYDADLTSHQIILSLQYNRLRDLLP